MTTNADEYNGWPNRETWATSLHLDNDEGTYGHARALARQAIDEFARDDYKGQMSPARWKLSDDLKSFVGDEIESVYHTPAEATEWARMAASDIGSLWRVEWDVIAASILSEIGEDE